MEHWAPRELHDCRHFSALSSHGWRPASVPAGASRQHSQPGVTPRELQPSLPVTIADLEMCLCAPFVASLGVLKPRPTFFTKRAPALPGVLRLAAWKLEDAEY